MRYIDRFIALTGGPGAGKTTLIDALRAAGFATTTEAGRAVIRQQVQAGGSALPWVDQAAFARRMAEHEMRSYREARRFEGPVFFDRALPDTLGYLDLCGLAVPPHLAAACRRIRYARRVFILPPWPKIYRADGERRQDLAEAVQTFETMQRVWSGLGYDLIEVPIGPVAARVAFVLSQTGLS